MIVCVYYLCASSPCHLSSSSGFSNNFSVTPFFTGDAGVPAAGSAAAAAAAARSPAASDVAGVAGVAAVVVEAVGSEAEAVDPSQAIFLEIRLLIGLLELLELLESWVLEVQRSLTKPPGPRPQAKNKKNSSSSSRLVQYISICVQSSSLWGGKSLDPATSSWFSPPLHALQAWHIVADLPGTSNQRSAAFHDRHLHITHIVGEGQTLKASMEWSCLIFWAVGHPKLGYPRTPPMLQRKMLGVAPPTWFKMRSASQQGVLWYGSSWARSKS